MNDIINMLLCAAGAIAGAMAILFGAGMCLAAVTAAAGGVTSIAIAGAPAVLCMGGVALAASRTGYGGNS